MSWINFAIETWPIVKNTVLPSLVSLGIVAAYLKFFHEKRMRAYELKLQKYLDVAKPLATVYGGQPSERDLKDACQKLNELYFFSSPDVVEELVKLNNKIKKGKQPYTQDIKHLIIAIRKDLGLKSKAIEKDEDFCMFQAKTYDRS
ncbi:hypothetical protein HY489_05585 [Candidatus Woesearchaeota archaeon]|nr:hypothetical protein [Candidatus Woesearchaeota archaeon]